MLNIINGKHVEASDKSVINIVNPYTGKKIDTVPNSTAKDVKKAVECAKKAQRNWAKVPISKKVELLKIFLNKVDANENELATTLMRDTGKPITQAHAEIANIRIGFEAFMEKAKHIYGCNYTI